MLQPGYVFINPQIEITEYGKDGKKSIILAPDSVFRIKNPDVLKIRYQINESAKQIILMMDGTKTINQIVNNLIESYSKETQTSIMQYISAIDRFFDESNLLSLRYSANQEYHPITYTSFENFYPSVISLELTNQCNMRCLHCYGDFGGSRQVSSIPQELLDSLFASFKEIGVTTVELTGGDPSVYPYTAHAIESAFSHGVTNITYLSNGMYLPADILSKLVKYKNNVLAQIDLHSLNNDYYKWFTGRSNALQLIKSNINKLVESGISVFVATIATPKNIGELYSIAKWAYKTGVAKMGISPVIELGRACGDKLELILSTENDLRDFGNELNRIEKTFPGFLKKAKGAEEIRRENCGAIASHATINHRGFLKICPMDDFPELGKTLGNALSTELKSIFDKNADFIEAFSNLMPPSLYQKECRDCVHGSFCHLCIARGLTKGQNYLECFWYKHKVPHFPHSQSSWSQWNPHRKKWD